MDNNMFGMNGFDANQARYERNNRQNPPEFAPGMGNDPFGGAPDPFGSSVDPFGGSSDPFGGSSDPFGGSSDPFGGSSDPFGGSANPFGGGNDPFSASQNPFANNNPFNPTQDAFAQQGMQQGMPMQNQQSTLQQYTAGEDKFFQGVATAGKASLGFIQDIVTNLQKVTPLWYAHFGKNLLIYGLGMAALGLIFDLFKFGGVGNPFIVSGCLTGVLGICGIGVGSMNKDKYTSLYKEDQPAQPQFDMQTDQFGMNDSFQSQQQDPFGEFAMQDNSDDMFGSDDEFPDSTDFSFSDEPQDTEPEDTEPEDDMMDWGNIEVEEEQEDNTPITNEEALSRIQDVPAHMYTRQYLFDAIMQRLPNCKRDFSAMKTIDFDDDMFLFWEECLREAAEIAGCKQENLPDLEKLQETMFTVILTCTRPNGMKADVVAKELAQRYAYDESKGVFNDNVFANAKTVGKRCIITIFTGKSAMVSLKDMMEVEKDWVLDPKVTFPVIFGIDQVGNVIKADAKRLESMIITGMPRSGKSWFVKSTLFQLCAMNSPNELQLYICDPKDGISDFMGFSNCMPHVKKFVAGDTAILNTVRQVVKQEGPRRKEIIGAEGFQNIWDYKEVHPEVDLPIIYVVIDEVVTLAERMEKETKQEFQGLLVELISQLPALGIRCILVPHVIKDQIIAKTATDLVPCKISILGDAEHIEKATGSKEKDFPYKLTHLGDMAVKMPLVSSNTLYVHAPVISESNPENENIFKYLQVIWNKIEPESAKTEIMEEQAQEQIAKQTISSGIDTSDMDINSFLM